MGSTTVGKPVPQVTSRERVTGTATYTGDMALPGMLHARLLRSPHPHARIVAIHADEARALRGVRAVLTGADVSDKPWGISHKQQFVLAREVVRFVGEEVAAVVADTPDIAQEAIDLIRVDYEQLPALLDPEAALEGSAPLVHPEGNLADEVNIERGDVETAFAGADLVFEETYTVHSQYPGYMEPMATLAAVDGTGRLTVWTSTQTVFLARQRLAEALDRPISSIRVIQPHVGGSFGAKIIEERSSVIAAFLATKVDRPVRLGLSRLEDIQSGCFSVPERIRLKMGMMNDGTIVAKQADILADCGAFAGLAPDIMTVSAMRSDNLQRIENIKTRARLVYTNTIPRGAFRGFGGTQMTFALNSHIATMADKLGLDVFDVHHKNAIRAGDTTVHGWKMSSCALPECLDHVKSAIDWSDKHGKRHGKGPFRRGVGMAAALHVSGNRIIGNWDGATIFLRMNEDARAVISTGESDMGQGAFTMLAQICSQELGIPIEHVTVNAPDTDSSPYRIGTIASRVTINAGNAMVKAARETRDLLLASGARMLECEASELTIRDGAVRSKSDRNEFVPLQAICREHVYRHGGEGIFVKATHDPETVRMNDDHFGNVAPAYSFATQSVEVEVDTETGQVRVLASHLADDCGTALNPLAVHGQSNGAAVQAIGWALYEEPKFQGGRLSNGNLADYTMSTADAVPTLHSHIADSFEPNGPLGAKGASETAILPGAAALANAVYDAIGVRITNLPITPEKILAGLAEQGRTRDAAI